MPDTAASARLAVIDFLKASAIVTVVWIHAFADPTDPAALPLTDVLVSWAVPAFFFASGHLRFGTRPVSGSDLARWLTRLLPPYVIASLLALGYRRLVLRQDLDAGDALFALLTGSAFPIYYFVPMLAGAYLLAALLSRMPGAAAPLFVLIAPVVPAGLDPIPETFGLFWLFRSPFLWWGYFLLGWLVAAGATRIAALPDRNRRRAGLAAAGLFTLIALICLLPGSWRGLYWPPLVAANYAALASLYLLGLDLGPRPVLRWLSDASYPIYLYHFFFTSAVRTDLLRLGPLAEPAAFAAGLGGAVLTVILGRRVLGRWSHRLIG